MGSNGETCSLCFKEMKLGQVVKATEKQFFSLFKESSQGGIDHLSTAAAQVPAENQTGWNLSVPMRNPHSLSHGCDEECEDRTVNFFLLGKTRGTIAVWFSYSSP